MNLENMNIEQEEQFMAWYQQIKQKEREEHIRKTKEGLIKAGAKPGRKPLLLELQQEIIALKNLGYKNLEISKELSNRGLYVSTKTIGKYVRENKQTKEGISNE